MKTPGLILGGALAFWGLISGPLWLGLLLGVFIEGARGAPWRWELEEPEVRRVADLCALLLVVLGVYFFTSDPPGRALLALIRWMPVLFFPLIAIQIVSGRSGIERSALFFRLRGKPEGMNRLDLTPVYLALCLLAAAMGDGRSDWYYPGLGLFAAWAFWPLRPVHRSLLVWGGALVLSIGIGFMVAAGVEQAQRNIEDTVVDWLAEWFSRDADPYRATTALGEIGELKGSERIVARVWRDPSATGTLLLRTASYNRLVGESWYAGHPPFDPLQQRLQDRGQGLTGDGATEIGIAIALDGGRGLLPLPTGTIQVQGLTGAELSANEYGAVKVTGGLDLARYQAGFARPTPLDAPPRDRDLFVPPAERDAMASLAMEIGLEGLAPTAAMGRIQTHFERHFEYSLRLGRSAGTDTPLSDFLLNRRSGHCEYFASAGVLLLRHLGIPTRYARGWSVQEYSPLEGAWVVRDRHAHAWVLVHLDGAWRDFDPTPPDWAELEAGQAPGWTVLSDLVSRGWFAFLQWRQDGDKGHLLWLAVPVVVWVAVRLGLRGRRRRVAAAPGHQRGTDDESALTPVEGHFARLGLGRGPGETVRQWLARLERAQGDDIRGLREAVELQYRARYEPGGISDAERGELARLVETWMMERNPS